MKVISSRIAGLALAATLAAASGSAAAHPWGYHGYHGGYHRSSGWVVGGAIGLAAAGTYLALSAPRPAYVYGGPVYVSPPPVYVAPSPVYPAPQYVAPPAGPAVAADVVAYPAQGQSVAQQTRDRSECERWAANQSGFDPAQASQWTTPAQTDTYGRAVGACLKGRGYSIN